MTALPTPLALFFVFCFGAMLGSFLNVVIYRVPNDESIVMPPSHCPRCETRIRWYDNIPVLSWFVLRGRCRHCREPFSFRYPFNEFLTGALFVLLQWRFGWTAQWAGMCVLTAALIAILWIDIDHQLILDVITFPGILLGLAYNLVVVREWQAALIGCVAGYLFGDILARVSQFIYKKEAFGRGDVKLIAMLGAWLGWKPLVVAVFSSFLLGSVVGLALMGLQRVSWGQHAEIPFGPALVGGGLLAIFTGPHLWDWYVGITIGNY